MSHPANRPQPDALIRFGAAVTAACLGLGLVAMSPLFTGVHLTPALWFLAMSVGLGFALILAGLRAQSKVRSRATAALFNSKEPRERYA